MERSVADESTVISASRPRWRTRIVGVLTAAALIGGLAATPASAVQPSQEQESAGVVAQAGAPSLVGVEVPVAPASTGQYTATCINLGKGYNWSPNNVPNCPGYLHVYISGNKVAQINTGGGSMNGWRCDLNVATGVLSILTPGGTVLGWAVKGLLKGLGYSVAGSCKV